VKRLMTTIVLVLVLGGLTVSSALAQGGKGSQTITATCTTAGTVTVHASSGQSAWVNNTHWVVLKLTGTFTPTNGTPVTFTKTYGTKAGFRHRTTDTCSGSNTTPAGTFSFMVTVARTH
jgi:hypothetical protein